MTGRWRYSGSEVTLAFHGRIKQNDLLGINTHFMPVAWGKRMYLVEVNQMAGFAACAGRRAGIPKGPPYIYVKNDAGGHSGSASDIPKPYLDFYWHGPIFATVSVVGREGTVRLHTDLGRVQPGLLLTTLWSDETAFPRRWTANTTTRIELQLDDMGRVNPVDVEVTGKTASEAVGRVIYRRDSGRTLRVGDMLTSGGYCDTPAPVDEERLSAPPKRHR